MTVQYVSDHWENFYDLNKSTMTQEQLGRLQFEYNCFFQRCTNAILSAEKYAAVVTLWNDQNILSYNIDQFFSSSR